MTSPGGCFVVVGCLCGHWCGEAMSRDPDHRLGAACGADPLVGPTDVRLDRVETDVEPICDLLVGQPGPDEAAHLECPRGQPGPQGFGLARACGRGTLLVLTT